MRQTILLATLGCFCALPTSAMTYFMSSTGNDSNSGTSTATPWLTPNHAVNCGDTILASAGTYPVIDAFGTVNCPAGNNVAWLTCATFDTCKISITGAHTNGIEVNASYWGVQGWEVTTSYDPNECFVAYPPSSSVEIHHIIFANNVANGCDNGGFATGNNGNAGVDYLVVVGNIAYNAAQSAAACTSGIDIYQPVQSDAVAGTHYYIGGNYSYANNNPSTCASGAPTDGEGIIIDTPDGRSTSGLTPYAQQMLVDNNILIANGGRGFEVVNNTEGSANANIYVRHNTAWGNNTNTHESTGLCGEFLIQTAYNTQVYSNIGVTNQASGCGGQSLYAYYIIGGNTTDTITQDVGWSATGTYLDDATNNNGFTPGTNLFGTNPTFANAVAPGAPSCGSFASVPACMATVIADFMPTTAAALSYGYQVPSSALAYDPLFPQWLCNVNLPAGLVTMGCFRLHLTVHVS